MINVTLNLWPLGFANREQSLGSISIWNNATSGKYDIGNYSYIIYQDQKPIYSGNVEGFSRLEDGAFTLLKLILDDYVSNTVSE